MTSLCFAYGSNMLSARPLVRPRILILDEGNRTAES